MRTPGEDAARWERVFAALADACEASGAQAWIVGGCLRDALLGRPFADADLAVAGDVRALAEALRSRLPLAIAPLKRDTVRLAVRDDAGRPPLQLDLAPLRGDGIAADLARRDFRCNALALPLGDHGQLVELVADCSEGRVTERAALAPALLDPLGGVRDLAAGMLRPASDGAFRDEPGRILRGARLIAAFGFATAPETLALARASAPALAALPPDRLRDELTALLALPRCAAGLAFLAQAGALGVLVPWLANPAAARHAVAGIAATSALPSPADPGAADLAVAPLAAVSGLRDWYAAVPGGGRSRIVALRWALLARAPADDSKGTPKTMPAAFASPALAHLSSSVRAVVAAVRRECDAWRAVLAEREPSLVELRLLAERAGEALVDVLVAAAVCAAAGEEDAAVAARVAAHAAAVLTRFFEDRASVIPPPLLDGCIVLRELGAPAGPELGRVLRTVRAAQLRDEVRTPGDALALARRLLA